MSCWVATFETLDQLRLVLDTILAPHANNDDIVAVEWTPGGISFSSMRSIDWEQTAGAYVFVDRLDLAAYRCLGPSTGSLRVRNVQQLLSLGVKDDGANIQARIVQHETGGCVTVEMGFATTDVVTATVSFDRYDMGPVRPFEPRCCFDVSMPSAQLLWLAENISACKNVSLSVNRLRGTITLRASSNDHGSTFCVTWHHTDTTPQAPHHTGVTFAPATDDEPSHIFRRYDAQAFVAAARGMLAWNLPCAVLSMSRDERLRLQAPPESDASLSSCIFVFEHQQ